MKTLRLFAAFMSLFSIAALGQSNPGRKPSEFPTGSGSGPFGIWEIEMKSPEPRWPDSNYPDGDWKDNRNSSTVSLKELQHKVPKKAMKEHERGLHAVAEGKLWIAEQHLENAINIDPKFAEAHMLLGVVVGDLGQTRHAVAEFQKTIELAPRNTVALTNLSVALFFEKRYHEACEAARRTLSVDSTLMQARYVLALTLLADKGDPKEALANLNGAARDFPEAHILASNLLVKIGQRDEAARHLEAYLRSARADDPSKAEVEARLAQLQQ